jgi:hypothetical protein
MCARVGSFIFFPPSGLEPEDLLQRLVKALDADSRVVSIRSPRKLDPRWTVRLGVFPAHATRRELIASDDVREALRFGLPLRLTLHVPRKNQPRFGEDDLPSEDYHVLWDGFSIVVAWPSIDGQPWNQQSGGHVAAEVLRDAVEKIGGQLYIQGCDPYCKHQFAHVDLFVRTAQSATTFEFRKGTGVGPNHVEVIASPSAETEDLAFDLFGAIHGALEAFTNMKNSARRILDLESALRDESDDLRALRVSVSESRSVPMWRWTGLRLRWGVAGWTRQSGVLIARLWRGIGRLEDLERVWAGERVRYRSECDSLGTNLLFEIDERDDFEAIKTLDVRLIQASVEEGAARLDSSALVKATAGAGVTGIIGVIVGHFLS